VNKRVLIILVIAAHFVSIGCAGEKGVDTRYAYEKKAWAARMAERGIWLEPLSVRDSDVAYAIAAYERALAENPLLSESAAEWAPRVRRDIERLRFSMKVALAKLYFMRLQQRAGITYFRSGLQRHDLWIRDYAGVGLSRARELYAGLERDPLEGRCAAMIGEIVADEHLWAGGTAIGDTLMAIPVHLARIERERGGGAGEEAELGEQFLGRIVRMWPDSSLAGDARLARADLYVVLERFDAALGDVDAILASRGADAPREEIELYRGELLAHGLGRYAEAESSLAALSGAGARTRLSGAALLDVAAIAIKAGNTSGAARMLRELEVSEEVAPETQTAAMFMHAIAANEGGDWGEAVTLLWRICRLHPFSRAGMVAPLVMIRHELAAGNMQTAESVHRKAVDFYAEAIERNTASLSYRHLVKDYLIESYLIMGDALGAAKFLEERAPSWIGDNGAAGLWKSALIYLNLLDDRENGVRMLEKSLDLFPSSRYAGNVRQRLDSLSHRQTVQ
jgi:tetratricopeptide (TPR) repeat protein